jgi:cytochrome c oxidase subunit 4
MTSVAQEETTADPGADVDAHEGGPEHPSDWQYIKIAIVLAILTALEVFTYFESVHNLGRNALIVLLMIMMITKIVLVMAWFMHLKFDSRTFTRMFVAGVLLACAVYTVMLTTFIFFWN